MSFRPIGQRDDRRRRVFGDGQWGSTASARRRSRQTLDWAKPVRKSENYGDAEFLEQLPRAVDLVPVRLPALLLIFTLGVAAVAGLEALYYWMPDSLMAVKGRVDAFDLTDNANLAVWLSSMMLAVAGLLALVVYSIRRYRTDDYHGHYRVWLWTALCCFLLSMDQTSNLRAGLSQMAIRLTGTPLYGDGAAWWLLAYGFLLGAVGTRLLIDVIANRVSALALVMAVACYGVCAACRFRFLVLQQDVLQVMLATGSQLLGNLLILAAVGFHLRHVLLDAEGMLPRRRPKPRREPVDMDEESELDESEADEAVTAGPVIRPASPSIVIHPPQGIPRPIGGVVAASPPASTLPPQPVAQPGPPRSIAEAESTLKRKLTKAERKALRHRLEKMQAERRKRAG